MAARRRARANKLGSKRGEIWMHRVGPSGVVMVPLWTSFVMEIGYFFSQDSFTLDAWRRRMQASLRVRKFELCRRRRGAANAIRMWSDKSCKWIQSRRRIAKWNSEFEVNKRRWNKKKRHNSNCDECVLTRRGEGKNKKDIQYIRQERRCVCVSVLRFHLARSIWQRTINEFELVCDSLPAETNVAGRATDAQCDSSPSRNQIEIRLRLGWFEPNSFRCDRSKCGDQSKRQKWIENDDFDRK